MLTIRDNITDHQHSIRLSFGQRSKNIQKENLWSHQWKRQRIEIFWIKICWLLTMNTNLYLSIKRFLMAFICARLLVQCPRFRSLFIVPKKLWYETNKIWLAFEWQKNPVLSQHLRNLQSKHNSNGIICIAVIKNYTYKQKTTQQYLANINEMQTN